MWTIGRRRGRLGSALGALLLLYAPSAQAQALVHEFINPSFGGNPFNSDHLLSIANLDRPSAPETPTVTPTPEDLLISQLQAQLNATLSSNILQAIQTATPGQTGEFTLGNTKVTFVRSTTETRVTFVNSQTGETREIVIPVAGTGGQFGVTGTATSVMSAERILSVPSSTNGLSSSASPITSSVLSGESALLAGRPPY